MPYSVIWSPKALEGLKALGTEERRRIVQKAKDLEFTPYHFIERLVEISAWRMRVGDYRVILDVDEKAKKIHVLKVGHRKGVYK